MSPWYPPSLPYLLKGFPTYTRNTSSGHTDGEICNGLIGKWKIVVSYGEIQGWMSMNKEKG